MSEALDMNHGVHSASAHAEMEAFRKLSAECAPHEYDTLPPDDFRALRLKQQESKLGDGNTFAVKKSAFQVKEYDADDDTLPSGDDIFEVPEDKQILSDVIQPSKGCISDDVHRARLVEALQHTWVKSLGDLRAAGLGRKIILCGGGASLGQTVDDIQIELATANPPLIMAVNKTHDWLIEREIIPDFAVLMDPREHIYDYITPHNGVKYLLGSSVDPRLWEKFRDHDVYLWHAAAGELDNTFIRDLVRQNPKYTIASIPGPSTVGLRSLNICAEVLGCPQIEMHGFDSCYAPNDGKLWAYEKPVTFEAVKIDTTIQSHADAKSLRIYSNADMARQVYEFNDMIDLMIKSYKSGKRQRLPRITVAGDGAIPWMAWRNNGHATPDRMQAKYGLSNEYDYRWGMSIDHLPKNLITLDFSEITNSMSKSAAEALNV